MKFNRKYISSKFPVVVVLAFLFTIGITWNMVKTMTVDYDKLMDMKSKFETDSLEVKPKRGNILSADGQLLASSLPDYKIYIDFLSGLSRESMKAKNPVNKADSAIWEKKDTLFHQNLDSICRGLSEICPSKTPAEYKAYLEKGWKERKRYYEICSHQVLNYIQYNQILNLPFFCEAKYHKYLVGLTIEERNNRKKPFGSLAKRTLGEMYGAKDSARSGLELAFDSVLRGEVGIRHRKKVRSKFLDVIDVPAKDGYDIITTIDVGMQDICETTLRAKLHELEADWGVVILMETKTGDVKSIVNLEKAGDGEYYEMRNWALAARMEPGSTFKTASIMVALDDGEIKYTDQIDTYSGVYSMHGASMKDHNWSRGGYHVIDVPHTLMYSSNIGVSRLIDMHYHNQPEKFINGLHRIGIAEPLGLPIPGAGDPFILTPDNELWSQTTLPWMSIGYSTQIPPISTVTFYNAIANDGKMMKPRFVKAIQKNGEIIEEFPPEVLKEQICKPSTLEYIRTALFRVVNDKQGTGKKAGSKRFHVSGKTGTAQVSQGRKGYTSGQRQYLVSFCGFYPSENPKYSCIVAIRKPGPAASGGGMAGPVFASIAEKVYSSAVTTDLTRAKDSLSVFVPEVLSGNIHSAKQVLGELNVGVMGDKLAETDWGEVKPNGTTLRFSKDKDYADSVPDLKGMGARDAVYAIESRGMKIRLSGVGKVVSQSIAPGTAVRKNAVVNVKLK